MFDAQLLLLIWPATLALASPSPVPRVASCLGAARASHSQDTAWELLEEARAARAQGALESAREGIAAALEAASGEPSDGAERASLELFLEIAKTARELGRADLCERALSAAIERGEAAPGAGGELRSKALDDLGALLLALGRAEDAARAFARLAEELEAAQPADETALLRALQQQARALDALGDPRRTSVVERRILGLLERQPETTDLTLASACYGLAGKLYALSDYEGARELYERALLALEDELPPSSKRLAGYRHALGLALGSLGRTDEAIVAIRTAVDAVLPSLGEQDPLVLTMQLDLAACLHGMGRTDEAGDLYEAALDGLRRVRPEEDATLQRARLNLGLLRQSQGDREGARELLEESVDVLERTRPPSSVELNEARTLLASNYLSAGDPERALRLTTQALEILEANLPETDQRVLSARAGLASAMQDLGDLEGSRKILERVLEVVDAHLPLKNPWSNRLRAIQALNLRRLGDLRGARRLQEQALLALESVLPTDDPGLMVLRCNLAATLYQMRDIEGARVLQERNLADLESTRAQNDSFVQAERVNLALTRKALGDLAGARELEERVVELYERTLPEQHLELQIARGNLAITLARAGELAAARDIQERIYAAKLGSQVPDHPDVQSVRHALAGTLYELGEVARARALLEETLGYEERRLVDETPGLGQMRRDLALALAGEIALEPGSEENAGRRARVLELVDALARGTARYMRENTVTSSVRELEEIAAVATESISTVLSFSEGYGLLEPIPELEVRAFELSETTRGAGVVAARMWQVLRSDGPAFALRDELRRTGQRLASLVQAGGSLEEMEALRRERERAESALSGLVRDAVGGDLRADWDLNAFGADLGPDEALVAYRSYKHQTIEPAEAESGGGLRLPQRSEASLCAFVLRRAPGGGPLSLRCVRLGPLAPIEALVRDWREAIGVDSEGLLAARGRSPESERGIGDARATVAAEQELQHGRALRARVLDPLLPALGDARRLLVALDGVLHLVPLEALPLDSAGPCVGDRFQFEQRVAFWSPIGLQDETGASAGVVVLGNPDFAAPPLAGGVEAEDSDAPVADRDSRAATAAPAFDPLPDTELEARGIAALHARSELAVEGCLLLEGRAASRESLAQGAPGARYLHLATHGWFAPDLATAATDEPLSPWLEASEGQDGRASYVGRMSPMLLCGIALAGANLPPGAGAQEPGTLTAEELASLDLAGCELAVLSACETSLGRAREGQGLASLQKALHMAGVRTVVGSSWRVPDRATRELMLDFYERVWIARQPATEALWASKRALRDARDASGRPLYLTRDWAGWVLSRAP